LSGADNHLLLLIGRGNLLKEVVDATENRRSTLDGKRGFPQGRQQKEGGIVDRLRTTDRNIACLLTLLASNFRKCVSTFEIQT
jgi:hypothetical protein